ncbi:MAG TPA: hypothetical protein VHS78_02320 [Candidatus Elarobacter sp.]|jgi:hypothetical protein|nr:hypothetical protein [Candidatus Elarobacter sp.]
MRWYDRAALTALVLAIVLRTDRGSVDSSTGSAGVAASCDDDPSFVYDAASRFNETLVGTIDAIDTALTAILAGNVAVLVFALDKSSTLERAAATAGMLVLGASGLLTFAGYVFGFRFGVGIADGVRPRLFVRDLAVRRSESVASATEQLIDAGEMNLSVRSMKRALALVSMTLLLAGLVLMMVSALKGQVIH